MSRMVEIGRQSRQDKHSAQVVADLWRGSVYERSLALQSTFGSGDGSLVVQAFGSDSRSVRRIAQYALPHVCTDDEILAVLHQTSRRDRYRVMAQLAKYARRKPVDVFLQELAETHDDQLSKLLALGSDEFLMRHLDTLLKSARWHDWSRLARYQPDRVLDYLNTQAQTISEFDPRLLRLANTTLPVLVKQRPAQTLALVRQL